MQPRGRGFSASASIFGKMRWRAASGSCSSSLRADRTNRTEYLGTPFQPASTDESAAHAREGLTGFLNALACCSDVDEILPEGAIPPKIDDNSRLAALGIAEILDASKILHAWKANGAWGVCLTDSVKLRRNQTNRALDVSASERLRAFPSSADSFNACYAAHTVSVESARGLQPHLSPSALSTLQRPWPP